jgi:hypothetical protein
MKMNPLQIEYFLTYNVGDTLSFFTEGVSSLEKLEDLKKVYETMDDTHNIKKYKREIFEYELG